MEAEVLAWPIAVVFWFMPILGVVGAIWFVKKYFYNHESYKLKAEAKKKTK